MKARNVVVMMIAPILVAMSASPNAMANSRLAELSIRMRSADNARVSRLLVAARPRGVRDSARLGPQLVPISTADLDSAWIGRFVDELTVRSTYVPDDRCGVAWWPKPGADQVIARVELLVEGRPLVTQLNFRERCAAIHLRQVSLGSFEIERNAAALLELVKQALPGDSALLSMSLPKSGSETKQSEPRLGGPTPSPVISRPTEDPPRTVVVKPTGDKPEFGEYVYVEELPEVVTKVPPRYPPEAQKAGIEGTVMLQVLVGKDGRVNDTRIVKSIPALDEAAVEAVRQWTFKPALAKGQPVVVWVAIPVKFSVD